VIDDVLAVTPTVRPIARASERTPIPISPANPIWLDRGSSAKELQSVMNTATTAAAHIRPT
jgi:hypothetical protein